LAGRRIAYRRPPASAKFVGVEEDEQEILGGFRRVRDQIGERARRLVEEKPRAGQAGD
jgi:hypothetical protein